MDKLDKALKRIKLLQEEVKLAGMIIAALSSAGVFLMRIFSSEAAQKATARVHEHREMRRAIRETVRPVAQRLMDLIPEGADVAPKGHDWIMWVSFTVIIIVAPFIIASIFKVIQKRARHLENNEAKHE